MKARKTVKREKTTQPSAGSARPPEERGINLEISGAALIRQAGERSAWHQRNAATITAELKALSKGAGADLSLVEQWKWEARRTDLARQMRGHEEYARFLDFVKRHVSRTRTYRVTLQDLSQLEIMPKGSYL